MAKTRVVIYLDDTERAALNKLKKETGASVAELCRRAITEWLRKSRKPEKIDAGSY